MKLRFSADPIELGGESKFILFQITDGFLAVQQPVPVDAGWREMLSIAREMKRFILDELHGENETRGEYLQ